MARTPKIYATLRAPPVLHGKVATPGLPYCRWRDGQVRCVPFSARNRIVSRWRGLARHAARAAVAITQGKYVEKMKSILREYKSGNKHE